MGVLFEDTDVLTTLKTHRSALAALALQQLLCAFEASASSLISATWSRAARSLPKENARASHGKEVDWQGCGFRAKAMVGRGLQEGAEEVLKDIGRAVVLEPRLWWAVDYRRVLRKS